MAARAPRWALVLSLCACAPSPRPSAPTPPAPVLDPLPAIVRDHALTLRGEVDGEVQVKLFTDTACAGPVFLELTSDELRAGATVELVPYSDNVFTAESVTARGVVSACSVPVRTRYLPRLEWGRPTVASQPASPSQQQHFVLTGQAPTGSTVELHVDDCDSPSLAELSADDYALVGFPVDVPGNSFRHVAVEARDGARRSNCAWLMLVSDTQPPDLRVRLGSPSPSPQQRALVVVEGAEDSIMHVSATSDCSGPALNACGNCVVHQVTFPARASTPFSVLAVDAAGNRACVVGPEPWVHEPTLPAVEAMVLVPGGAGPLPAQVLVPVGVDMVQIFATPDCSQPLVDERGAWELVLYGLSGTFPGAQFVSVRGLRSDGRVGPCSNALQL